MYTLLHSIELYAIKYTWLYIVQYQVVNEVVIGFNNYKQGTFQS